MRMIEFPLVGYRRVRMCYTCILESRKVPEREGNAKSAIQSEILFEDQQAVDKQTEAMADQVSLSIISLRIFETAERTLTKIDSARKLSLQFSRLSSAGPNTCYVAYHGNCA